MYPPDIELHECKTLQQASKLMERHAPDARLLAGGTDLLVDLKSGRVSVRHVVSINRISVLRGVSHAEEGLRIGALTTIAQLHRSPIVRKRFAAILDATGRMAAPQIRNMATVGGNIVSAVPCADLPPILTVMNASVVLWSPVGERSVPLEAFFVDVRKTVLRGDEVLTAVVVPDPPGGFGAAYARLGLREGNAIAVAAVAASLHLKSDGIVREASVVLGAVAPTPRLAPEARAALVNRPVSDDAFADAAAAAMQAAEPISDVRGSADFRRQMVGVLARRALTTAYQRATESRE